jgi:alkylhydroperoxidase family enzyme
MTNMRNLTVLLLALVVFAPAVVVRGAEPGPTLAPLAELDRKARSRVDGTARVALAAPDADALKSLDPTLLPAGDHVPNYLRALAVRPDSVAPFAKLVWAVHSAGKLEPEIKAAMGLRIAQVYGSPYVAVHEQRALRRLARGEKLLAAVKTGDEKSLTERERLALLYAELLTRDVHGVKDADFDRVNARFDDSEVVELTLVTCFFNYFVRLCEGLALPVESWALAEPAAVPVSAMAANTTVIVPRIGLVSDAEMDAVAKALAAAKEQAASPTGLGLGIANSQRAMLRSPEISSAWRAYGTAVRAKAVVERSTMLQVSFAVSMANDCRYCTVHQVLGLRRLNVDISKLVAMKKDDASLTPRELAAVLFARKLTSDPLSGTPADYDALRKEFGEDGALDVLMQTSNFSFMNRFTDGLRLPSEDEAIRVYREVYGQKAY